MLFKKKYLDGIKGGKISLAFRKWKKPTVKKGSLLKTDVCQVEIQSIKEVTLSKISEVEALKAGYTSLSELTDLLETVKEGSIYRIEVGYHSPDPRIELRSKNELTDEEFVQLKKKLERLDQYSKSGNWTREVLEAVRDHPHLKALDLAEILGREKEWLKLNIRKLKNLGLTISHNPGYELSPLGKAYLKGFQ
ncbi:MAG: ASCH domain-containing protein [Bacteroidota bacterium]